MELEHCLPQAWSRVSYLLSRLQRSCHTWWSFCRGCWDLCFSMKTCRFLQSIDGKTAWERARARTFITSWGFEWAHTHMNTCTHTLTQTTEGWFQLKEMCWPALSRSQGQQNTKHNATLWAGYFPLLLAFKHALAVQYKLLKSVYLFTAYLVKKKNLKVSFNSILLPCFCLIHPSRMI